METLKISDALEFFKQFLFSVSEEKKKCLLVAHNAGLLNQRVSRLLRAIMNAEVLGVLDLILGFADTLSLFRTVLVDRKGTGQFKLETLSKDFLQLCNNDQQSFHDAAYDVVILQDLINTLKLRNYLLKSYCN